MEIKNLMIGDWVKHSLLQEDCKVVSIDVLNEEGKVFFGEDTVELYDNEFEPIPITDEILKNNEFVEINDDEKWYKLQLLYENDFVGLEKKEDDYWIFAIVAFPNYINHIFIKYFHELQHALRLVGLNEIADNLKV